MDVKTKYFLLETKMWGVETEWRRLGDIARGTETVSWGLEVLLEIWRLGGHFSGEHGASAPLHGYIIEWIYHSQGLM